MRPILIIALLFLSACQSAHTTNILPTSERLEEVRMRKLASLNEEMSESELTLGDPAFIRIFKYEGILETWVQAPDADYYLPFKKYKICKFSGGLGPKLLEGDGQAPEGFYSISADQMNPWSEYHLSMNLGYPNEYDSAHNRTGSHLMIHGDCKSIGCYAITDKAMEEVYLLSEASIAAGHPVPVHIFPFRMTPQNMHASRKYEWTSFWWNLKEGYDAFETTKIPPSISVADNRYAYKTKHFDIAAF